MNPSLKLFSHRILYKMNPKYKKPYVRKGKKASALPSAVSLVKAVAKKVVSDALEDKYVTTSIVGTGLPLYFNAAISSTSEIYPLLPAIVQGTNANNRVGDKIRPKRLRVDFVITANGSYTSSQLNQVRVFILEDKSIRFTPALRDIALTQIGTPIATQLLDFGSNPGGFLGLPSHVMARANRQRYTVFADKVKEICSGSGITPQPPAYTGTQVFVSGQQCVKFSVRIPTPKVLKYSQALDTWPSNFAPFMCLGYVQPDGNISPDNLLTRVACNWVAHLDYEDA